MKKEFSLPTSLSYFLLEYDTYGNPYYCFFYDTGTVYESSGIPTRDLIFATKLKNKQIVLIFDYQL